MSWVNLSNCLRNTKGLIPSDISVQVEAFSESTGEFCPLGSQISLQEFIDTSPHARGFEWIVKTEGFHYNGELRLNFSKWVSEGGDERLIDVIQAEVCQWGNWAYKRTMDRILTKLNRLDLYEHELIKLILEHAGVRNYY